MMGSIKGNENSAKPLVSIIVPAYNVQNYISECLTSLCSQTLKNIEIIIVDDGSSDRTPEIISEYAQIDSRIKFLSQANAGQGAARNRAIDLAEGEYIGFVDSDDWIENNYFEQLYNVAKSADADISVANILKHKKYYKKYTSFNKKIKSAEDIQGKIALCQDRTKRFFYCWNKLCRASLIKDNNIRFTEGRYFEDVNFSMKVIFFANKVVTTPKAIYNYIEHSTSTVKSKNNLEKKLNDHKFVQKELIEFAKTNNIILPERLNYVESKWINPFLKVYKGPYMEKFVLLGCISKTTIYMERQNEYS